MTAIIITGRKRGGPRQMASYLTDQGENESITVRQINGFVAKTVKDALAEMWAVADGSKAKDFLYHATINPRPGVKLSQEQWKQAVDRLEKNLKLTGHQRVVVEHVKNGRTHYHVVWNRINPLTGYSRKLFNDWFICRNTALQLGEEFKLEPTSHKGQSFERRDIERGKRTGIDPKRVKEEVTILWNQAKSGQEFIASLQKHGYILARGDRNQFVIIDKAGSTHGLRRRIQGATAKTIKRGLADIDITTLPTIQQVKEQIKAARPKRARAAGRQWQPYAFALTTRGPMSQVAVTTLPVRSRASQQVSTTAAVTTAIESQIQVLEQPHQLHFQPVRPNLSTKSWPEAAIKDWEAWGKRNPPKFFALWPECKPDGVGSGPRL